MKSGLGITSRLSVEYDGIFPYSRKLVKNTILTFSIIVLSLLFVGELAHLDPLRWLVNWHVLHVHRAVPDVATTLVRRGWTHEIIVVFALQLARIYDPRERLSVLGRVVLRLLLLLEVASRVARRLLESKTGCH
jgi:hypothetical protein